MADIIAFQLPLDGLSSYSQKTTWFLDQSPDSHITNHLGQNVWLFLCWAGQANWTKDAPCGERAPTELEIWCLVFTYMTIVLFVSLQWPLCFTNLVCKFVKTNHYPNTQVLPERYEEMKHRNFFRIFQVIKNKKLS